MSTRSDRRVPMLSRTCAAPDSRTRRSSAPADGARAAAARVYDTPVRSWTTPSCRSCAIRRRSRSDASTACWSRISLCSWLRSSERVSDQASGSCTSWRSTSAPITIGAKLSQMLRPTSTTPSYLKYASKRSAVPSGVVTGRYVSRSLPCAASYRFSGFVRLLISASDIPPRSAVRSSASSSYRWPIRRPSSE